MNADVNVGLARVVRQTARSYRIRPVLVLAASLAAVALSLSLSVLVSLAGALDFAVLTGSREVVAVGEGEIARVLLLTASWAVPLLFAPYLMHVLAASLTFSPEEFRRLRVREIARGSLRYLPHSLLAAACLIGSVMAGMVMFLLPGWFALMWGAYMLAAVTVERIRPAWKAWGRSRDLAGVRPFQAAGLLGALLCFDVVSAAVLSQALEPLLGSLTAGLVVNPLIGCFNLLAIGALYFRLRELET